MCCLANTVRDTHLQAPFCPLYTLTRESLQQPRKGSSIITPLLWKRKVRLCVVHGLDPPQRGGARLVPSVGAAEKATFSKVMALGGTASSDSSVRGTDTGDAVTLTQGDSDGPS